VTFSRSSGEEGKERRGFLQADCGVVVEGQYDWLLGLCGARGSQAKGDFATLSSSALSPSSSPSSSLPSSLHRIVSINDEAFDPFRTYVTPPGGCEFR
jgi:hypothetical protein